MAISEELAAGIARLESRLDAEISRLGGLGSSVRGVGPDGREHVGALALAATKDQGLRLVDAEGKHWRLATLEPANAESR